MISYAVGTDEDQYKLNPMRTNLRSLNKKLTIKLSQFQHYECAQFDFQFSVRRFAFIRLTLIEVSSVPTAYDIIKAGTDEAQYRVNPMKANLVP